MGANKSVNPSRKIFDRPLTRESPQFEVQQYPRLFPSPYKQILIAQANGVLDDCLYPADLTRAAF